METNTLLRKIVAFGVAIAAVSGTQLFAATAIYLEQPAPVIALKSNAGKKWETDAHVRKAMSEIRDLMFAHSDDLYFGKMDGAKFDVLAQTIDSQTAYIIENCRLSPEADAQLHFVLTQIMQGSVAMQGRDPNLARRTGAERVVGALEAYSRHFEHPGWKALAY